MNNGVVNNQTNTNNNQTTNKPVLTPMEGVTIAPVGSTPVSTQPVTNQPVNTQNQAVTQQIPVQQNTAIPQQPVTNTVPQSNPQTNVATTQPVSKKKKKSIITPFLFMICIGLGVYSYYITQNYTNKINQLNYNCTPVKSTKQETELDINSTLVKGLYEKVATNIREDIAQPEFNDNMRLYLAYRQIIEKDKYDTNCQGFSNNNMEPYTCEVSTSFVPKGFKEETLVQKIKELYGERTELLLSNIQLGKSCIVGYQYIPSRKEYVQGICNQQTATSYKVTKTLKKAISTGNTIILTEEVTYHANEKMALPDSLRNGNYYYTFRLDMNYNYILASKTYESKY